MPAAFMIGHDLKDDDGFYKIKNSRQTHSVFELAPLPTCPNSFSSHEPVAAKVDIFTPYVKNKVSPVRIIACVAWASWTSCLVPFKVTVASSPDWPTH
jgi:hypothetical protein